MEHLLTETQKKIVNLLSDGQRHHRDEIKQLLPDDLASRRAIYTQISRLRQRLNPAGKEIVCEIRYRKPYYRMVRLLATA